MPNDYPSHHISLSTTNTVGPPPPTIIPPDFSAIADSGSTAHFCTISAHVINKRVTANPIGIANPNGAIMYSTHEADLDLPSLPLAARRVHIVPALQSASLLSMAQLCDAGCQVTFDATSVRVHLNDALLLTGIRAPATGLWHLNLTAEATETNALAEANELRACTETPLLHHSYAALHSATPAELVTFAHASLFSPALSTLQKALERGYLPNFMGLTTKSLRQHPPQSVAMVKGHLDQTRKNLRSTKQMPPVLMPGLDESNNDPPSVTFPISDPGNARTHYCYASVFDPAEATGQIHSDQTGKFIVSSSTGNNYVLVVYDYDSNNILVEPMRSRSAACILAAFTTIHARLVAAGLRPCLQRLDNECSEILKDFLRAESIDFQLAPPYIHRRNAAERAIRTFKNHFIAGLCSVDKNFPLHLWDKLLPQAETTLNLLRGSRLNPRLSAHAQMHGHFDFNRTPIAPPGIRVLVHIKPTERTTWSPHGADGWYVGPALDSYRCYTVWLWDTRATRICDTLAWFPTKVTMPIASSNDLILAGIADILHALRNPSPGSPLAPLTDSLHEALLQLTHVLTNIARPPNHSVAPDSPIIVEETNEAAAPITATPLRVEPAEAANPLPEPVADKPLRVETPVSTQHPTIPDAPLRVPIQAPKTVTFAPVPSTSLTTYDNSTGARGNQRRRAKRKQKPAAPLLTSKTIHPRKLARTGSPKAPPTHAHGTRANQPKLTHIAASARMLLLAEDAHAPQSPFANAHERPHYAFHGHAINPDTGKIAEYRELSMSSDGPIWKNSNAEEIGRLAQGYGDVKGTNTIYFINVKDIPPDRVATYLRVVSAYRPEKAKPHRIRWTAGGDKIDYPFDVSTKTADLTTVKLLATLQQCPLNAKRQIHGHRPQRFFSRHAHGAIRVHAHSPLHDSQRHQPCQRPTHQIFGAPRLPPRCLDTRFVEAQD